MYICNVVYDEMHEYTGLDAKTLERCSATPCINVVKKLGHCDTTVPTLMYGYKFAKGYFEGGLPEMEMQGHQIELTYLESELRNHNFTFTFIETWTSKYFEHRGRAIDMVFLKSFTMYEFAESLNEYPLIHEGNYEIYVAHFNYGTTLEIFSFKKDTLQYLQYDPKEFLESLYKLLSYKFLTIDSKRFNMESDKLPIFIDELLYAKTGNWVGTMDVIDHFSHTTIDRKQLITFYMREGNKFRDEFQTYQ